MFRRHALLKLFEVERTATGVNVAAVGFGTDAHDVTAECGKKFGAKLVGGAVGAVQNDAEVFERSAGDNAATQEIEILMMKRIIGTKSRQGERGLFRTMFQDSRFNSFLDRVRELHPFVRKQFNAVVLVGIVGSGNHDTNVKIILADEAGDAGSGEYASKGDGSATLNEAGGYDGRDVGTGFASIGTDEGVGRGVVAVEIFGDGKADGEESGVVERGSSGNAADTICSKKLSRHRVRGRWAPNR